MTNFEKLRALADWFDAYDLAKEPEKRGGEVQKDLRAMANEFEQFQQHNVSGWVDGVGRSAFLQLPLHVQQYLYTWKITHESEYRDKYGYLDLSSLKASVLHEIFSKISTNDGATLARVMD